MNLPASVTLVFFLLFVSGMLYFRRQKDFQNSIAAEKMYTYYLGEERHVGLVKAILEDGTAIVMNKFNEIHKVHISQLYPL